MARPLNAPKPLPDVETLKMIVEYDGGTGKLYWKELPPSLFSATLARSAEQTCRNWNAKFAGKEAGSMQGGYKRFMFGGQHYMAHRAVWKIAYGEEPIQIDHVDGDRTNNRLENLRDVSHQVNAKNRKLYECNNTEVSGVSYHARDKVWQVRIGVGEGKDLHVGNYTDKETAVAVRLAVQTVLDYHPNHGRK